MPLEEHLSMHGDNTLLDILHWFNSDDCHSDSGNAPTLFIVKVDQPLRAYDIPIRERDQIGLSRHS